MKKSIMTMNTRPTVLGRAQQRLTKSAGLSAIVLALVCSASYAFESGSTGADGMFAPTENVQLTLPPDGVFNYTGVNIPAGVTVTYINNAANTPVIILAQNDVVIDGTISVNGQSGMNVLSTVTGGPGGAKGGRGGEPGGRGGHGFGPGGGTGGVVQSQECGGAGGGYGFRGNNHPDNSCSTVRGGATYGLDSLIPLLGGSGGGGGSGASFNTSTQVGGGGGAGGGAILIAASGTLTINGAILARGGNGSPSSNPGDINLGAGGGGSGGGIRLLATTIEGTGSLDVRGGSGVSVINTAEADSTRGGYGRAHIASEFYNYAGTLNPVAAFTISLAPGEVFVDLPTIRITSVAGVQVPAVPTGTDDVVLPGQITNPVTVEFSGVGIPLGTDVTLSVQPLIGTPATAVSTPLAGEVENSTATASVNLPLGPSVLVASVDFEVTSSKSAQLSGLTNGEPVKRVELTTTPAGGMRTTLITESGKEFSLPGRIAAAF